MHVGGGAPLFGRQHAQSGGPHGRVDHGEEERAMNDTVGIEMGLAHGETCDRLPTVGHRDVQTEQVGKGEGRDVIEGQCPLRLLKTGNS